jgi:hypothetical protein
VTPREIADYRSNDFCNMTPCNLVKICAVSKDPGASAIRIDVTFTSLKTGVHKSGPIVVRATKLFVVEPNSTAHASFRHSCAWNFD